MFVTLVSSTAFFLDLRRKQIILQQLFGWFNVVSTCRTMKYVIMSSIALSSDPSCARITDAPRITVAEVCKFVFSLFRDKGEPRVKTKIQCIVIAKEKHGKTQIIVFIAPRPKAQVCSYYCDHALSVVRPSLTFHMFDLSKTAERNSTKLDWKQDINVIYQVCVFWTDRKNKMTAMASDLLRHFRLLLWNHWTKFNDTWQEARSQHPLTRFCFSSRPESQDGHPGLCVAATFSTISLKPLNGIQRNLTGSKISTSSTKFVF